jgi:hypothetical protein
MHLVSPVAPYFDGRELLVAADCVAFADPNFHQRLLKGRSMVVGCPKLDETSSYAHKTAEILKNDDMPGIIVAHIVVPCCAGMLSIVNRAVEMSGRQVEVESVIVGVDDEYHQSPF